MTDPMERLLDAARNRPGFMERVRSRIEQDKTILDRLAEGETNMPNLAEIAYNAYGESRGWKVFDGGPMPTWDEQSDELKQAWDAAAQAVATTLVG